MITLSPRLSHLLVKFLHSLPTVFRRKAEFLTVVNRPHGVLLLAHFCFYPFLSLSHTHLLCLSLHPSFCASQTQAHLLILCSHHSAFACAVSSIWHIPPSSLPLNRLLIFQILPRASLPPGQLLFTLPEPSQSIR